MVLTKLEFQRRGFAKTLFREALKRADEMGIETIKLDGTDQGQPLYQQFGFRGEEEIVRWSRQNSGTEPLPVARSSTPVWRDLDAKYFGADRLSLLERLAEKKPPAVHGQSYLFSRPGRTNFYLGPCASDNPKHARNLISSCVEGSLTSWYWDLFASNQQAATIASELGFIPQRRLLRMARGRQFSENRDAIYAIAGFELG
jgi:hypothetical protein